jgi:putative nucleotidyltransferase with HDIG domain
LPLAAAFRPVSALFSPVPRDRFFGNFLPLCTIPRTKIAFSAPFADDFCALCVNFFLCPLLAQLHAATEARRSRLFKSLLHCLLISSPALHSLRRFHYSISMPNRDDAWKLLCEYTQSESLRKHMLAVETCVRTYARKNGADEETWGLAALLHDFDYERWPNAEHSADKEHPAEGARILRDLGYSEEITRAILSHADYSGVARQSALEHTLFACDELAGFLTACSYVRPSKSILDLEVDSVKKRMKDKAFARGVSRDDVRKGAEELGLPLEEHIAFCIAAMRENADALGLRGNIGAQAATS